MIPVFFGTETGNAELVAEDICDALNQQGLSAQLIDLEKFNAATLTEYQQAIWVCSTYGDGELPGPVEQFYRMLEASATLDLSLLKFAGFGLGDSYYETFNNGIQILSKTLKQMGAEQIGELGVHDASQGGVPSDVALAWLEETILPLWQTQGLQCSVA